MVVRSGYADMVIDYASLACFWSRLTDEQKKLIIHKQFDYLPDDAEVKKESVLIVWSKLTKSQKKLVNCGFFHGFEINRRATRAQKAMLLKIQLKHEKIINPELVITIKKIKKGFHKRTSPGSKENWSTYKLAQKIGHSRCWYTGEECTISISRGPWSATREHIIPQVYGWNGKQRNTTIAANFVNNLLGCAPIHVKMHVRRELSKISCLPTLNGKQKKKIYKQVINNVLNQYRVCGSLPWETPKKAKSAKASIIKMAYYRHMIIQKNYVDNIQENSDNVRGYLEENCDGMEIGFEQAYGLR